MNSLLLFNNPEFGEIRISKSESGEPLLCLLDVANALGYLRPADAVNDHCKGVVILPTPTSGGIQQIKFGSEGNVYRLVMRSKLPDAEKFQDWVCEEVLPSLRKHGGYLTPEKIEEVLLNPDTIIRLATQLKLVNEEKEIERREKDKFRQIVNDQSKEISNARPKVLFADAVMASGQSVLIGELSKILKQKGIEIGQNRLFEFLRENSYLCVRGESYNLPTQKAMELELFEIKKTTITQADGTIFVTNTTKVTPKGQVYFVNMFLKAA